MKKLLTLLSLLAMFAVVGCESFGGDGIFGESYSINGAIQKGPFVQGSNITIQPLNSKLKPIGQMYTTQTTNDAGMFEMDEINSKYAEIIATGYYFDEVEGKISASTLTLRSVADLEDGTQTNVNLLTTLTYNRIKNLVTNDSQGISEAQKQAERELYTALGIPEELHPNVNCGSMNIANNGEGDGLLLAISAVMQEGRSVGELSEFIAKMSADLANDGTIEDRLINNIYINSLNFNGLDTRVKQNLETRYTSLGIESNIPDFAKYIRYFEDDDWRKYFIKYTYDTNSDQELIMIADVDIICHEKNDGEGIIYFGAAPTSIEGVAGNVLTIEIPEGVTTIGSSAFSNCLFLESISLPQSLTHIGGAAFYRCPSLKSVHLADLNAWFNISMGSNRSCPFNNGADLYINGELVTDIVVPAEIQAITLPLFYGCASIKSVDLNNVFFVNNWAFTGCKSLEKFTGICASADGKSLFNEGHLMAIAPAEMTEYVVPEHVSVICSYAFMNSESLKSVILHENISLIQNWAFEHCTELENVYCKASYPPHIETETFSTIDFFQDAVYEIGCTIYVPTESVEAYKSAENWSRYADQIVGYDFE